MRDNPHKYLLYKPSLSQLMVFLSSGFKELPPGGALLLYISADGCFSTTKHPQDCEKISIWFESFFKCFFFQMDMSWVVWRPAWNEKQMIAVECRYEASLLKSLTAYIPVICIPTLGVLYSSSSTLTIRLYSLTSQSTLVSLWLFSCPRKMFHKIFRVKVFIFLTQF